MAGLNESNVDFAEITYNKIIKEIIKVNSDEKFKIKSNKYHLQNISKLAIQVSKNLKDLSIENVLDTSFRNANKFEVLSTLSFKDDVKENIYFKELGDCLRPVVDELNISPASKDMYYSKYSYIKRDHNIGIKSNFSDTKSLLRRIAYKNSDDNDSVVRQDIIEICQDITNIENDIEKSLTKYYLSKFKDLDEDDMEDMLENIKNRDVLVNKIRDFIITYRDGYLKRVIGGPVYLNFIRDITTNYKKSQAGSNIKGYELFNIYVSRINDFEKFIQESIVNDSDDMYQIEYLNSTLDFIHNIRTQLIYEQLPFSGKITSPLSDTRDESRNNGHEVYGISLKRNGKVASKNANSSFEYHIRELNYAVKGKKPSEHNEKVEDTYMLKQHGSEFVKALLYKYMLLNLDDPSYDALKALKEDLVKYKMEGLSTTQKARTAIGELIEEINKSKDTIMSQLDDIKELLNKCLDEDDASYKSTFIKKFSLLNAILPKTEDLDDGILLENIGNKKNYNKLFKYTTLLDNDIDEKYYSYSYDYEITLTSHTLHEAKKKEEMKISCDRDFFNPFSIVFYPTLKDLTEDDRNLSIAIIGKYKDEELMPKVNSEGEENNYEEIGYPTVFIDYCNNDIESEVERFVYETAYTIITSIISSLIANKLSYKLPLYINKSKDSSYDNKDLENIKKLTDKSLYIMPIQLTCNKEYGNKPIVYNEAQSFVRILRKSISSSLSIKYTGSTQGYNILGNKYKSMNSISSLFNKVHRNVDIPGSLKSTNKIAIIVATSRKHNNSINSNIDNFDSTIYGEVITANKKKNGSIKIASFCEFNDYLNKEDLHKNPTVLSDIIVELKSRGYKDIVYLAHSPFTATMIEKKDKTEMYFMNEEVIKTMIKDFEDVNIYPLYINECSVHHNGKDKVNDLNNAVYSSSTKGMYQDNNGEYEGIIPLFQLFSGNAVNEKEDNFYSQMVVYSTIKGIYSDEISKNIGSKKLLSSLEDNEILEDIKSILMAIHIIRNEKNIKSGEYKPMKNNPYDNIFGDESIGSLASSSYIIKGSKNQDKQFTLNRFSLVSYIIKTIVE